MLSSVLNPSGNNIGVKKTSIHNVRLSLITSLCINFIGRDIRYIKKRKEICRVLEIIPLKLVRIELSHFVNELQ
jgi:hypothetical protein